MKYLVIIFGNLKRQKLIFSIKILFGLNLLDWIQLQLMRDRSKNNLSLFFCDYKESEKYEVIYFLNISKDSPAVNKSVIQNSIGLSLTQFAPRIRIKGESLSHGSAEYKYKFEYSYSYTYLYGRGYASYIFGPKSV